MVCCVHYLRCMTRVPSSSESYGVLCTLSELHDQGTIIIRELWCAVYTIWAAWPGYHHHQRVMVCCVHYLRCMTRVPSSSESYGVLCTLSELHDQGTIIIRELWCAVYTIWDAWPGYHHHQRVMVCCEHYLRCMTRVPSSSESYGVLCTLSEMHDQGTIIIRELWCAVYTIWDAWPGYHHHQRVMVCCVHYLSCMTRVPSSSESYGVLCTLSEMHDQGR